MEEPVSVDPSLHVDPVLYNDSACALVELHPPTPEHFVSNQQVIR